MNKPLLVTYIFQLFFLFSSIIVIYFGFKLFKFGIENNKQKTDKNNEIQGVFFSGKGPGFVFMIFGCLMLLFSIFTLDIENRNKFTQTGDLQFLQRKEDAIIEYVLKNQEDIKMMKDALAQSDSLLNKLSSDINYFEKVQNQQFYTFQNEIDSSRNIIEKLNKNFATFHSIKDTLLDKKISNSKLEKYLTAQDNILLKAVKMLEILNNRQNILERTVVRLHQGTLGQEDDNPEDLSKIFNN